MSFGRKRNETGNQFEGLLGQGNRLNHEVSMADLMVDMNMSVKKHSRRGSGNQSSQEYQNVESALSNVVFTTNGSFTDDVTVNEKMMTQAMGNYYKLLAACEAYIAKSGGFSMSGRARRSKVQEIQKYAQRDIMGIEQAYHAMKSMSAEQQSTLSWDEIFHSSRMEMIEVDDYSDKKLNIGGAAKTGDNVGKMLKEGIFAPNQMFKFGEAGANISSNALADAKINKELTDNKVSTSMSNRNVATSRVANLIGLGNIVEQSTTVKVKDKKTGDEKTGSLMSKARGTEMLKTIEQELSVGLSQEKDIQKREQMARGMLAPSIQKQLSSLQVLDYLCGQGDRHRANYFAEKKGEKFTDIHGIDNDMSFSTGTDTMQFLNRMKVYNKDGAGAHQRVVVDSDNNLVIPHMDRQLAKNILDLKPDELRFVLKDLLEPTFIDLTIVRLEKLQTGIQNEMSKENSKVFVDEGKWNENTMEDFLSAGFRRKVSSKISGTEFQKKNYFDLKLGEEAVELSKSDNYIASLMDDMLGFDNGGGYYKF